MENYFYFVGAGAVSDPEGGGDMGECLSPGAPVRTCPLGNQPGTPFGLERAIPYGSISAPKGLGICRDVLGPGQFDSKGLFYARKQ